MSLQAVVRTAVRLGVVVSVALAGLTFSADDAEARRGGKVRSHSSSSTPHEGASTRKSHDGDNGEASSRGAYTPIPRVRSREATPGDSDAVISGGHPALQRNILAGHTAPMLDKDLEVDGCAAGMICTVCVAGCAGDAGEIVDSQSKAPAPEPRE